MIIDFVKLDQLIHLRSRSVAFEKATFWHG